jgi:hypothetical protein
MGKNITRRNRKTKKMGKKNRSKKMRGGGDVMPGARIDFKTILSKINKNIKYKETNLVFCDALHVRFLNDDKTDNGDGLFFFYNYKYKYFLRKAAQAGRIADRTINPFNSGTVFGRNLARGINFATSLLGNEYEGSSETAWIKSDTAKFVEKIATKIGVPVYFKENTSASGTNFRLDDMADRKYDIFKDSFNGIYFMYTSKNLNLGHSGPYVIYKKEDIYNQISLNREFAGTRSYCIFKFKDLHLIINNFVSRIEDNLSVTNSLNRGASLKNSDLDVFQADFTPTFTDLDNIFHNEYNSELLPGQQQEQHENTYTIHTSVSAGVPSQSVSNTAPSQPVSAGVPSQSVSNGVPSQSVSSGEQIMDAIDRNDTIELQKQLSIANDTFNFRDSEGRTPLYLAVKKPNLYAIEELIKYPGVDVNLKNNKGFSPLHFAISYGDIEAIKILIQRPDLLIDDEAFNQNKAQNESQRPDEFIEINNILSQKLYKLRPPNTNFERPRSRKNE